MEIGGEGMAENQERKVNHIHTLHFPLTSDLPAFMSPVRDLHCSQYFLGCLVWFKISDNEMLTTTPSIFRPTDLVTTPPKPCDLPTNPLPEAWHSPGGSAAVRSLAGSEESTPEGQSPRSAHGYMETVHR